MEVGRRRQVTPRNSREEGGLMGEFVELFLSFLLAEATGSQLRHRLGKQCSKGMFISAVLLDILKHGSYQAHVGIKKPWGP